MAVNWLTKYHEAVDKEEILVCNKLKQQIAREKSWLQDERYYFDVNAANYTIDFIEKFCVHYKGPLAGQLVHLELWQKHLISSMMGFKLKSNDTRLCRDSSVILARKNGKTFLAGGLGLYFLTADGESAPEIYSVATKKEQANLLYKDVWTFVQRNHDLSSMLKKTKSSIDFDVNGGTLKALASDSNSLDGLNPSFWIKDEIHAWKDKNLEEVLRSGSGARLQPMGLAITTSGTVRGQVYDQTYEQLAEILSGNIVDDTISAFIYELDDEDEVHDEDMWIKANPNIDISVSRDFLRGEYKRAQDNPFERVGVYTKNFNIPMNSTEVFFSLDECKRNPYDESILEGSFGFMGLDMGLTTDITVLTYLMPETETPDGITRRYTKQWYIVPEERVPVRLREDKVNYLEYVDMGEAVLCPGDRTKATWVLNFIEEIIDKYDLNVMKFGIDPWRANHILETYQDTYGDDFAVAVHNGYRKALTPTIYNLQADLRGKHLYHNSYLLEMNLAGCVGDIDKDDTVKLIKKQSRHRIDGSHSLVYAYKAEELYNLEQGGTQDEI